MSTNDLVILIIDYIEGGYYHPDMKAKLKNGDQMLNSGETMFGLDRKAGGPDVTSSANGKAFWQLVDAWYNTHHGDTSYYNDKADGKKIPKEVGLQLRELAAKIISDRYKNYSSALNSKAKKIVDNNPALLLQFVYGCYNGQGNFNNFANIVNNAVNNGITDPETLYNLIQTARRNKNSHYAKGADLLDIIKERYLHGGNNGGGGGLLLGLLAVGIGIFFVTQLTKK
mgnify:FL=1